MTWTTADLCDTHGEVQVAQPLLSNFGGLPAFHGPIATVRIDDDYTVVRALLEQPGAGRVLVVDNGGSLRCAVVGDRLGALAIANGWAGLIVHGCIRDSAALAALPIGVRALGTMPRRSDRRSPGEVDIPVTFAGVTFVPGHHCYADADGIIVAPAALT